MIAALIASRRHQGTPPVVAEHMKGLGPLTKRGMVLGQGPESFDAGMVESPVIWWDPTHSKWGMVYTGYTIGNQGSIGLAWSTDLLTWEKAGQILAPTGVAGDPDAGGLTGPYVWLEGGTYHLLYIGMTQVGYEAGTKALCLATAPSITGPWLRRGVIIAPGGGGGWRQRDVWHPNIVKYRGKYHLFINGTGGDGKERIGYASSTSILGPWAVDDTSVILDVAPGWESNIVGDPSVYRVGDTWYMAYYGFNGAGAADGIATTTDAAFPRGWVRHPGNPILTPGGAPGGIDNQYAHKPFIVNTPLRHHHFYTGVGSQGRVIALATQDPISE